MGDTVVHKREGHSGGPCLTFYSASVCVITEEVADLAAAAKRKGAVESTASVVGGGNPLVQELLDGLKGSKAGGSADKKGSKVVHLVKNVAPLPATVVERIQDGAFVDFAFFPVFDDGPGEAGDWRASPGEGGENGGGKRKPPKEVPDLSGWSTCFTLFQVAWASSKPEMWVPLAAYRESIFKLARRYRWGQVARYDRRFRQEAAGKSDVQWEVENLSLLLDVVHTANETREESRGDSRRSVGGGGVSGRRAEGVKGSRHCFKYNSEADKCSYGAKCKFQHVCRKCGGEHPVYQCSRAGLGKDRASSS